VLRESKGQIGGAQGAALRLGLKRTTLNSKLKKLGIERREFSVCSAQFAKPRTSRLTAGPLEP